MNKNSNKNKLLKLNKGDFIVFVGEFDKLGSGLITHHSIKNVKITNSKMIIY